MVGSFRNILFANIWFLDTISPFFHLMLWICFLLSPSPPLSVTSSLLRMRRISSSSNSQTRKDSRKMYPSLRGAMATWQSSQKKTGSFYRRKKNSENIFPELVGHFLYHSYPQEPSSRKKHGKLSRGSHTEKQEAIRKKQFSHEIQRLCEL